MVFIKCHFSSIDGSCHTLQALNIPYIIKASFYSSSRHKYSFIGVRYLNWLGKFVYDKSRVDLKLRNWAQGNPSRVWSRKCVMMHNGQWINRNCGSSTFTVCERLKCKFCYFLVNLTDQSIY